MISVREIKESFFRLLFPGVCPGCGNEIHNEYSVLCLRCINDMPETSFERYAANPVEKKFWGRIALETATAQYYFTRESLMQTLMHEFKYRGNKALGLQLGRLMGERIAIGGRINADVLVPLPLFEAKERKRGFNQSTLLCQGMTEVLRIPVLEQAVVRPQFTETQTKKGRVERWRNMDGKFVLKQPDLLANRHVLLIDDVVTTGATLEACGTEILKAKNCRLSIATLCFASRT